MHSRRHLKPSPALGSAAGGVGDGTQDGVAEAKELNEAAKIFSVTADLLLDVAETGRIDDPANREKAIRFHEALGAALV